MRALVTLMLLALCAHAQYTPQTNRPSVPLVSSLLPSQTALSQQPLSQVPTQALPAQASSNLVCPILNYPNDFDVSCIKFDPFNTKFRILFTMKNQFNMPDWIDVHYQVNGGQVQNHRLGNTGNGVFMHEIDNVPGLVSMNSGDVIQFYFTYSIKSITCDSMLFSFTVPAAGQQQNVAPASQLQFAGQTLVSKQQAAAAISLPQQSASIPQQAQATNANCPMLSYPDDFDISCIKFDHANNKFRILFTMKNQMMMPDWIDVHYQVNGNQVQNHRMGVMSSGIFSHEISDVPGLVSMNAGDIVQFFFTYSMRGSTCDTSLFAFTVPRVGEQQYVSPSSQQHLS